MSFKAEALRNKTYLKHVNHPSKNCSVIFVLVTINGLIIISRTSSNARKLSFISLFLVCFLFYHLISHFFAKVNKHVSQGQYLASTVENISYLHGYAPFLSMKPEMQDSYNAHGRDVNVM